MSADVDKTPARVHPEGYFKSGSVVGITGRALPPLPDGEVPFACAIVMASEEDIAASKPDVGLQLKVLLAIPDPIKKDLVAMRGVLAAMRDCINVTLREAGLE